MSVTRRTQAWVFTLEVPISSWRRKESMSWLSSNEPLQQNLFAFSLCLKPFSFLFSSHNLHFFLSSYSLLYPCQPIAYFLCQFFVLPPFSPHSPFASALALSFCVDPSCLIIALCFQQTSSVSFFLCTSTLLLCLTPLSSFSLTAFHVLFLFFRGLPVYFLAICSLCLKRFILISTGSVRLTKIHFLVQASYASATLNNSFIYFELNLFFLIKSPTWKVMKGEYCCHPQSVFLVNWLLSNDFHSWFMLHSF